VLVTFGMVIGMLAYFFPAMIGVPLAIALAIAYAAIAQWLFNTGTTGCRWPRPCWRSFRWRCSRADRAIPAGAAARPTHQQGAQLLRARGVARDLTDNRSKPDAFNKVVYGTCFATDMSGFSTISEQLPPTNWRCFSTTISTRSPGRSSGIRWM